MIYLSHLEPLPLQMIQKSEKFDVHFNPLRWMRKKMRELSRRNFEHLDIFTVLAFRLANVVSVTGKVDYHLIGGKSRVEGPRRKFLETLRGVSRFLEEFTPRERYTALPFSVRKSRRKLDNVGLERHPEYFLEYD